VIGHDGSDPGATTFLFYLPEPQLGFVLLLNADTAHALEVLNPDIGSTLLEAAARLHARRR
jgi:CubicO group peptidase (beta-lactamase class C family)